jgi:hypothetical protein
MKKFMVYSSIVICLIFMFSFAAYGDVMYADKVLNIYRGTNLGNFSGYYGGTYSESSPVELTENQAKLAVLGAPDGDFLSLPGDSDYDPMPAYVTVGFATNFLANHLYITEVGANAESAHILVYTVDGSFVQYIITRNGTDTIDIDLSSNADVMNAHGGAFTKVMIFGLDAKGASYGFDLDAVGVTGVPEPATMLLLGLGLIGLAGVRRKLKK